MSSVIGGSTAFDDDDGELVADEGYDDDGAVHLDEVAVHIPDDSPQGILLKAAGKQLGSKWSQHYLTVCNRQSDNLGPFAGGCDQQSNVVEANAASKILDTESTAKPFAMDDRSN